MSDQGALFDQFLRKQQDILADYQKSLHDACQDRQTLTRLALDSAKGETVIYGEQLFFPYTQDQYQIAQNLVPTYEYESGVPGGAAPFLLTAIPIELRNSKKFRFIWSAGSYLTNGNSPPFPPTIFAALSQDKGAISNQSLFFIMGAPSMWISNFLDVAGNDTIFSYASLDFVLPVAGNRWIHLYGFGDGETAPQDFFGATTSQPNLSSYQLIA